MGMRSRIAIAAVCGLVMALGWVAPALAAPDAYEPDNTVTTARRAAFYRDVIDSGAQAHTFTSARDVDWVRFSGVAWREYSVKVHTRSRVDSSTWVRVQVFRKTKTGWKAVTSERICGPSHVAPVEFFSRNTTTYAVRFRPYRRTAAAAGQTYFVRFSSEYASPRVDDRFENADDTKAGAKTLVDHEGFDESRYNIDDLYKYDLVFRKSGLHNIRNPRGLVDNDWFKFSVNSLEPHSLIFYTGLYRNHTMGATLYDASGTVVGSFNDEAGVYRRWELTDLGEGTYYLRVWARDDTAYWYRIGLFGP